MSLFDLLSPFFPPRPPLTESLQSREAEAERVVNAWAVGGGALAGVTRNRFALCAADSAMISGVARAFGVHGYDIEVVAGVLAAAAAREVADHTPLGHRQIVRGAVNAALLKLIGEAVISHFRECAKDNFLGPDGRGRIGGIEKVK